jgi:hypothetical protein
VVAEGVLVGLAAALALGNHRNADVTMTTTTHPQVRQWLNARIISVPYLDLSTR